MLRNAKLSTVLLLIIGITPTAESRASSADASTLYAQFREYRLALGDQDANTSTFFSRRWNEYALGWLLKRKTPTTLIDDVPAIRNRYRFGESIYIVHAYDSKELAETTGALTLIYRTRRNSITRTLTIGYILEYGQWRIDKVDFDSTRPRENQRETVVDRFDKPTNTAE